jgi:sulfoxide reductase heme-binding subunit YedZ
MLAINLEESADYLGYLSILGVTVASYPTLSNIYSQQIRNNKYLSYMLTRWGLIITIALALCHGLLTTQRENINFYDLKTYWIYGEGLLTLNLIVFLAFSFRELRLDCKKIIYFIYALLFFIGCHLSAAIA